MLRFTEFFNKLIIKKPKKTIPNCYKLPTQVHFEITDKCNLFCSYCYRFDTQNIRESSDINDKKIMELAKKIVKAGVFSVVITGGEPFARKKLVIDLVRYFKENNITVSINTNLLLVDKETIEELAELRNNGFLVSCVSTDPDTYKKLTCGGDFEKFKEKLKLIQEYGFSCMISTVVTKENLTQIRQTAIDLKNLGIKRFSATPMSLNIENPRTDLLLSVDEVRTVVNDLIWIYENLNMSIDSLEPLPLCVLPPEAFSKNYNVFKRKCSAGKTSVAVTSTGDVKPCPHMDEIYGNLFKESFEKVFSKMHKWKDCSLVPDECKDCKALSNCSASCRANAKALDGNLRGKGPWYVEQLNENPIKLPTPRPNNNISLSRNTTLLFNKDFKYRKEEKDKYLLKVGNDFKIVNERMLKLIKVLKVILPLRLSEVADELKISPYNEEFIKDIRFLSQQKIIIIKNDNCTCGTCGNAK